MPRPERAGLSLLSGRKIKISPENVNCGSITHRRSSSDIYERRDEQGG